MGMLDAAQQFMCGLVRDAFAPARFWFVYASIFLIAALLALGMTGVLNFGLIVLLFVMTITPFGWVFDCALVVLFCFVLFRRDKKGRVTRQGFLTLPFAAAIFAFFGFHATLAAQIFFSKVDCNKRSSSSVAASKLRTKERKSFQPTLRSLHTRSRMFRAI